MPAEQYLILSISGMDELSAALPQPLSKPFKSKESLLCPKHKGISQDGRGVPGAAILFTLSEEDNRNTTVNSALLYKDSFGKQHWNKNVRSNVAQILLCTR